MIPYFQAPSLHLGPLTIEPFGVLVALGILLAATVASRVARADGRDVTALERFAPWGVAAGVVGAHLVHLCLYHPEEFAKSPVQLLKIWDGLASTGGVLGGVIAAAVYFRSHKVRFGDYSDAFALGMAPGWGVARLGCFAVHDHMGSKTAFPLAVAFPGGARHDLGLDDALVLFGITALLVLLRRRGALTGRLMGVLALLYAVGRFSLDFLRANDLPYVDARYLGLTPAQYACFILVAYGVFQLVRGIERAPVAARAPRA